MCMCAYMSWSCNFCWDMLHGRHGMWTCIDIGHVCVALKGTLCPFCCYGGNTMFFLWSTCFVYSHSIFVVVMWFLWGVCCIHRGDWDVLHWRLHRVLFWCDMCCEVCCILFFLYCMGNTMFFFWMKHVLSLICIAFFIVQGCGFHILPHEDCVALRNEQQTYREFGRYPCHTLAQKWAQLIWVIGTISITLSRAQTHIVMQVHGELNRWWQMRRSLEETTAELGQFGRTTNCWSWERMAIRNASMVVENQLPRYLPRISLVLKSNGGCWATAVAQHAGCIHISQKFTMTLDGTAGEATNMEDNASKRERPGLPDNQGQKGYMNTWSWWIADQNQTMYTGMGGSSWCQPNIWAAPAQSTAWQKGLSPFCLDLDVKISCTACAWLVCVCFYIWGLQDTFILASCLQPWSIILLNETFLQIYRCRFILPKPRYPVGSTEGDNCGRWERSPARFAMQRLASNQVPSMLAYHQAVQVMWCLRACELESYVWCLCWSIWETKRFQWQDEECPRWETWGALGEI